MLSKSVNVCSTVTAREANILAYPCICSHTLIKEIHKIQDTGPISIPRLRERTWALGEDGISYLGVCTCKVTKTQKAVEHLRQCVLAGIAHRTEATCSILK